jgi:hypothetical protein
MWCLLQNNKISFVPNKKYQILKNPEAFFPSQFLIPIPNRSRSFDQIPIPTEVKTSIPLGSKGVYHFLGQNGRGYSEFCRKKKPTVF